MTGNTLLSYAKETCRGLPLGLCELCPQTRQPGFAGAYSAPPPHDVSAKDEIFPEIFLLLQFEDYSHRAHEDIAPKRLLEVRRLRAPTAEKDDIHGINGRR